MLKFNLFSPAFGEKRNIDKDTSNNLWIINLIMDPTKNPVEAMFKKLRKLKKEKEQTKIQLEKCLTRTSTYMYKSSQGIELRENGSKNEKQLKN